ncbi:MAG TPA: carboxymuconolactone decarboxylase family protein [Burkholderiales bacterium]|nr:carboxymuconolactone decarboxylase family protein [Burkholderiales bacterium]
MARISPAPSDRYVEVADYMERWKKTKGYPPNSWLTMLRKPRIFRAYRDLHTAVMMDDGDVPQSLKFMVAYAVSAAAGDPYCAAHNAENAAHIAGLPVAKVEALPQFRSSAFFTPAERAALELAAAAGRCPPAVTDTHFAELKKHYNEDAATEIVAVIALLGWLNRWNVTLATRIEGEALAFAEKHLAPSGWTPGMHADTIPVSLEKPSRPESR